MKIKLDSLVITEYCSGDKRKFRFINEITKDQLIGNFVSHHMNELLCDSEGLDDLVVGPAYIIAEEKKLVGFIRLAILDLDGVLNLHYGVHPDFRRKHYGTKILQETSTYLFERMKDIKKIELYINELNKGSIMCAENAWFKCERTFYPPNDVNLVKVYSLTR